MAGEATKKSPFQDAVRQAVAGYTPTDAGGDKPAEPKIQRVAPANMKALPPLPDQERVDRWDPVHKGAGLGLIRMAMVAHRARHGGKEVEKALEAGDFGEWGKAVLKTAMDMKSVNKSLAASTLLDGGGLLVPQLSDEFLPLLRAATVILEGGARVIEMDGLMIDMGRQNSAATAGYANELQAVTATQQTFGKLGLASKKLITLTGCSNDLIRKAGPSAEAKVRDDMVAVTSLKKDISFIRADGTGGAPRGLKSLINSSQIFAATQAGSSATFAEIAADADKAKYLLRKAKIARYAPISTWRWIMGPRAAQYLETVSSTYGVFPFADEMESKGTFRGIKVLVTEALPENLGGGSNESEIYLVAMPCLLIGQSVAMELMFFPNGAAVDVGGSLISGISSDASFFRCIDEHDSALAYDTAGVEITTVKWGA